MPDRADLTARKAAHPDLQRLLAPLPKSMMGIDLTDGPSMLHFVFFDWVGIE